MADDQGRWLEPLLLDPLPAPPADWITVPGGVVLAVQTPPGVEPYRWYPAVALAWAQSPATAVWGVLLAWEAMRRGPVHDETAPRYGWHRFDPDRCRAMKATPVPNGWGLEWWGKRTDSATTAAVREALALLPAGMRAAAVRPATPDEAGQLPTV
jgi:hypothetical protein